ncbi:MAG TPA: amino acid permease [Leptolyngbyaceae cyanobacterium M33_DOE_097]|uniref:histidine kinase n=1 Tax=Oscillatoriales cyanobacterium SpSt-418 TaxID=2282169 RepID=A0A7C3PGW6_9CYAN|nr:amino acid permease [Leptolyngbyaceae cyanobacterium M33_DOE_097]
MRPNFQPRRALPRELSSLESLAFCLTGVLVWQLTVGFVNSALGASAIWVWLPGVVIAVTLTLQVKHYGNYFPDVSGGTANYTARLLARYPLVGTYAAIGYYISWVAGITANALILTSLINTHMVALGLPCPETFFKVSLTLLPFILAFTGTRALALLHMVFMLPAIGFVLIFTLQGLGWLAFSPDSPGLFDVGFPSLSLQDWIRWFFVASFTVYIGEGGSAFIADSRMPKAALRGLSITACLIPLVYVGGSWVVARLSPDITGDAFLTLAGAAFPFWGKSATALVTLLIASAALLATTTTVAVVERILYQLALDSYLSPVFGVISRQGVMSPALIVTVLLSLGCLAWGNLSRLVEIANVGYLVAIATFHWGCWLNRTRPEIRWPHWSLFCFLLEVVVLIVGGLALGIQDFLIGLGVPAALLVADRVIRWLSLPVFQPWWWQQRKEFKTQNQLKDFLAVQLIVLIFLLIGATIAGWQIREFLAHQKPAAGSELLGVLVLIVAFVGVAIAAWTSLPQITAIAEARQQAEHLFTIAQDGIVVLNQYGLIQHINPAAAQLFEGSPQDLLGYPLQNKLKGLLGLLQTWLQRSTQRFHGQAIVKTLEVSISEQEEADLKYLVILRDVSERVATEKVMRQQAERERVLSEIALNMHQSLELEQILGTAVAEVRQFLQTDRVFVYQLRSKQSGVVLVESVAAGYQSILGWHISDTCFTKSRQKAAWQEQVQATDDIYTAGFSNFQLELLACLQVRANLVVPIWQGDSQWGLLIVQHCQTSRVWQPSEIDFLKQLAIQAAIAIHQSELYRHEQRLNLILEQQVEERTAQLQQALQYEAMLKRITDKVRDSLDENQILQTAVEELVQGLGVYSCDMALFDLERATLSISHTYTAGSLAAHPEVKLTDEFLESCPQLLEGESLQFCEYAPSVMAPVWQPRTIFACPIINDQEVVLGALRLFRSKAETFSESEVRLALQVANQCAIAIRQARLYQAAQGQVKALEELNQLKDDFLSTVSHELRTPISNMKMAIHMLQLMMGDEERRDRYIKILQAECNRESDLINDLLDLQRLASGTKILEPETIDLQDWLPQITEPFRERTQARQQVLQISLCPNLPGLTTDPTSLNRILAELLNNACKYTPPDEKITLSVELVNHPKQMEISKLT